MSRENVETIRRVFESSRLTDRMDEVLEALDPAVELHGAVGGLEEGAVVRGAEPVSEAVLVDLEIWAERRFEVQRLVDVDDRVVALLREHRRGRGSDVEVQADIAIVYRFKKGRIVRIEPYMSQAQALEAVGLREE